MSVQKENFSKNVAQKKKKKKKLFSVCKDCFYQSHPFLSSFLFYLLLPMVWAHCNSLSVVEGEEFFVVLEFRFFLTTVVVVEFLQSHSVFSLIWCLPDGRGGIVDIGGARVERRATSSLSSRYQMFWAIIFCLILFCNFAHCCLLDFLYWNISSELLLIEENPVLG